jgi:tol-pal system protein YbgF
MVLSQPVRAQDFGAPVMSAPMSDAPASSAAYSSTEAVMDRLNRLERDIRTLNQQIARGPSSAAAPASVSMSASKDQGGKAIEFTDGESMLSRLTVRLSALENEVRAATGQSESLSYRIDQLTQRFDKLLVDLDYRLSRLEGGKPGGAALSSSSSLSSPQAAGGAQPSISAAPSPAGVSKLGAMPPVGDDAQMGTMTKDGTYQPPADQVGVLGSVSKKKLDAIVAKDGVVEASGAPASPDAPGGAPGGLSASRAASQVDSKVASAQPANASSGAVDGLPDGNAQDRYRYAFDLTRQARYEEAEIAFKAFVKTYPDDDLANNARYWLAETYYVRKRFMDAAQSFFEAYQKAPKGSKAPDALLKLGMSMAALDKPTEACATFGKLRKEFTPMKDNIEQALNREVKSLKCK